MIALLFALLAAAQDDTAATEALNTFEAAFSKAKDPAGKAAAVSTLSGTHHEKVVSKLGSLLTHEDKAIRNAAIQGLAGYTKAPPELHKSAAHALTSALSAGVNVRDSDTEVAIFTAIGNLQEESSGSALKSHFEDKDVKIAGAAVSAAGALKSKAMVEPLIELLQECERATKSNNSSGSAPTGKKGPSPKVPKGGGSGGNQSDPEAAKRDRANSLLGTVQSALQTLTGQNLSSGDEWQKWWSKNRGSFTPAK